MNNLNLILLRGVSGAGKSTVARLFTDAVIISTDDYFLVNGVYKFEGKDLVINHIKCQEAVEDVMQEIIKISSDPLLPNDPKNTIVVHNTFTKDWEMQPYLVMADKYGYMVHTLIVENRHGSGSTHEVPQSKIDAQRERFQVIL